MVYRYQLSWRQKIFSFGLVTLLYAAIYLCCLNIPLNTWEHRDFFYFFQTFVPLSWLLHGMACLTRRVSRLLITVLLRMAIILNLAANMPGQRMLIFILAMALILETYFLGSRLHGALVSGMMLAVTIALQAGWANGWHPLPFWPWLGPLLLTAISGGIGWMLRDSVERYLRLREHYAEMEKRLSNLADVNLRLQNFATLEAQEKLREERARIARDIHDSLAYILTNISYGLDVIRAAVESNEMPAAEELLRLSDLVRDGQREMRGVIQRIRTSPGIVGGLPAVKNLVDTFQEGTGISIDLSFGDAPNTMGDPYDEIIYRMVQEGITNALRHGLAQHIIVTFRRVRNGVSVRIRDDGDGCGEIKAGYGLSGMGERLAAVGGTLSYSSKEGEGFLLEAWLPLEAVDQSYGG